MRSWSSIRGPGASARLPYSDRTLLRLDLAEHFVGELRMAATPSAAEGSTGEERTVVVEVSSWTKGGRAGDVCRSEKSPLLPFP